MHAGYWDYMYRQRIGGNVSLRSSWIITFKKAKNHLSFDQELPWAA